MKRVTEEHQSGERESGIGGGDLGRDPSPIDLPPMNKACRALSTSERTVSITAR